MSAGVRVVASAPTERCQSPTLILTGRKRGSACWKERRVGRELGKVRCLHGAPCGPPPRPSTMRVLPGKRYDHFSLRFHYETL
jgi:hypothetical protein